MERENFTVGPAIMTHLIQSQAGTLEKAILECYMNSTDAEATRVDINFDPAGRSVRIDDDGHGWTSMEEIRATFGRFAFDHDDGKERVYGKFGLGRGQLWNWCHATYHTNTFMLHVDIRENGMDFGRADGQPDNPGCLINATFYEPLDPRAIDDVKRALKEWLRYASVPVFLDGEQISRDPAEASWTEVTEEAYFHTKDSGMLLIYNQGVFVSKHMTHEFGLGGVVVSRSPLALNMARNDVLRSQCKVWPGIRKTLRKLSGQTTAKRKTLTDAQRSYLLRDWLSGSIGLSEIADKNLIVDARGRSRTLFDLSRFPAIAVAPTRGTQAADRAIAQRAALVLAPEMLDWFGVETIEALRERVMSRAAEEGGGEFPDDIDSMTYEVSRALSGPASMLFRRWEALRIYSWESVCSEFVGEKQTIPLKESSKKESAMLSAAEALGKSTCAYRCSALGIQRACSHLRAIRLGQSDTALAWTDGASYITVDRSYLKDCMKSPDGMGRLMLTLLHEYTHDSSSLDDTHGHSQAFFEDFHDVALSPHWAPRKGVDNAMRSYARSLRGKKLTVPRWVETEGRVFENAESAESAESVPEPASTNTTNSTSMTKATNNDTVAACTAISQAELF